MDYQIVTLNITQ